MLTGSPLLSSRNFPTDTGARVDSVVGAIDAPSSLTKDIKSSFPDLLATGDIITAPDPKELLLGKEHRPETFSQTNEAHHINVQLEDGDLWSS